VYWPSLLYLREASEDLLGLVSGVTGLEVAEGLCKVAGVHGREVGAKVLMFVTLFYWRVHWGIFCSNFEKVPSRCVIPSSVKDEDEMYGNGSEAEIEDHSGLRTLMIHGNNPTPNTRK